MAEAQPPTLNGFMKAAMNAQVWMLRRGLMGSMSDQIMVITVTGRKSGRRYSTPIGFLRDELVQECRRHGHRADRD